MAREGTPDLTNGHDPAVAVDGLTFSYGAGGVLHGISFTLRRGEVVGLLGPNGAGKSTTIKILTGILPPGDGSVRVAGHVGRGAGIAVLGRLRAESA